MNNTYDFEKLGKKTPYTVPDGFFDEITNSTLEKAKKRERQYKTRKLIFAWSAAASFFIILSVGIFLSTNRRLAAPSTQIAVEKVDTVNRFDSVRSEENGVQPELKNPDTKFDKEAVMENSNETIDDLLAEMDEEELQQMAELLSGELFIDELTND